MLETKDPKFALVLMSGGIDSTACAQFYKEQGFRVEGLFIDHGQRALEKERLAISAIEEACSIPIKQVLLSGIDIPVLREVPGRNAFFLFTAFMYFPCSNGIIAAGIHSGTPYYDCSEPFIKQVQEIFDGYSKGRIAIGLPFLRWNKLEVWSYLQRFGSLSDLTYSCELGLTQPCGKCNSCKDLEALYAGKNH